MFSRIKAALVLLVLMVAVAGFTTGSTLLTSNVIDGDTPKVLYETVEGNDGIGGGG